MLCNHTSIVLDWPWRSQEEESKLASKPLLAESTYIPRVLGGSALVEGSCPRYLLDTLLCSHVARGLPGKREQIHYSV